jgi:peptidoglycan/LPS O-acetylase OafA/YrhL
VVVLQFRKDINGLRALAVIAVVLYHFNESWMSGGFAGVDVFFVISGFLMTAIIFKGIEQQTFSIIKFYKARANRIIPPLAVLCIALLIFAWFFELNYSFSTISKHIISSLGFFSNITYWKESGYFDAVSHEKWLLHSWSLSVEWQFYILYPLVLVAMKKFMPVKVMKASILVATVLSFILCIIASNKWPTAAYYLLPARAWEMMLGGLAFLYPLQLKVERKKLLEYFGLLLVISSYVLVSKESIWPGYLALFPALGTFFIIIAHRDDSRLMNNAVFQKLGTWSYSIYLWHWPLVVFMNGYLIYNTKNILLLILLSLLLGMISYKLIEKKISGYTTAVLLLTTLGAAFTVNIYDGSFDLRAKSQGPDNQFIETYKNYEMDPSGLFLKCNASYRILKTKKPKVGNECISSEQGGIFLWGDSHIGSISTGLRKSLGDSMPFNLLTSSGCAPSFVHRKNGFDRHDVGCDYSNDLAYQVVLDNKPEIVVLGQRGWHEKNDWGNTIKQLHSMGVLKVVIIGPLPQWKPSLPAIYLQRHKGEVFISDPNFDKKILESNAYLNEFHAQNKNFIFIDMLKNLCSYRESKLNCRAKIDDTLITFDYGHLTVEGSNFVAENYIYPKIIN